MIFDDAEIDYGFFRGSGSDFKPVLMEIERSTPRRWHFTSQIKVHLQSEFADVESYNFSIGTTALIADENGQFAQLNKIGYASVQHPEYRPLKD